MLAYWMMSGTWYFSNFFFVVFHNFLCCFTFSTLLSICFTLQEKIIRVLLIPRRSRAQCTTTTDDPFQALSTRPSLGVVYRSISPSLSLAISPSRTSSSSPDRGIRRSRRYPPPTFTDDQPISRSLQPRNGTSEDPSLSQDPSSPDSLEDS